MISLDNLQLSRRFSSQWLGSGLLVVAWLCVSAASWHWLAHRLLSTRYLLSTSLLAVGLSLSLALHHRKSFSVPILRLTPLLLMVGSAVGAIACSRLLDFAQLSVLLNLVGTYGLLGLFLAPKLWQRGLPAATLFACVVPFGLEFSSGLGFSARILTSHAVEQLLAIANISALSSHDIIVLENGIAQVDLPCSGLKSLWTGTIFLLAATWLEGRRIGGRWLLVFGASLALLVWSNVARVLCLVVAIDVLGLPKIGEILHVSLGILSFAIACLLIWGMLQWVPPHQHYPQSAARPAPFSAQIGLCAVLFGLAFIPQTQPHISPLTVASIHLPSISGEPIALSKTEQEFFAERNDASVKKQRFTAGPLSGSMLMVASTSWQNHHSPELCLVGSGFKIDSLKRAQLAPDVLGRWLTLDHGTLAAAYWFQTPQQTTDDILKRFWQEITRQEPSWVMISVLFDQNVSPDSDVAAFTTAVSDAISQSFHGS